MTGLLPVRLRCEHLEDPLGIGTPIPRLTWALQGDGTDRSQRAYRVLCASQPDLLDAHHGDLWDSGRVESREQLLIPYAGAPLRSRQTCFWKVITWDEQDTMGPWSETASWETGLLLASDWQAVWIEHDVWTESDTPAPCPLVRRAFTLPAPPVRARLYVSALGLYEAHLNGRRVGDRLLTPGWTDYHTRVPYQTYDVTAHLHEGLNVIGAVLGDGWFCGHVGYRRTRRHYGPRPRLLAQLEVELATGELLTVGTDHLWEATTAELRASDFLHGETIDARLERPGWSASGGEPTHAPGWAPVVTTRWHAPLVADAGPPVRALMTLDVVAETRPAPGVRVLDLGQNMVGWTRARVHGEAGQAVILRFAEMLDDDGTLYTAALRSARATDTYLCRGDPDGEVFEPRFTFHGFRFVEVTGDATLLDLVGVVVGSDTPRAGTFECASADVNQLQRNIEWGQRGNFLSVPTDCPQRDERLGWLGDAQVFAPTATYNADVAAFFTKWMQDVEDAQSPAGGFPDVAPRLVSEQDGAPGWGDAGVILPWVLYGRYGDLGLVRRHWAAMQRWMTLLETANPDHVRRNRRNNDYGDWLAQDGDDPRNAFGSRTPKEVLATAYWAYGAALMRRMATALGRADDAERYAALHERIREAFLTHFVEPHGWISGRTQTGQVLALAFDLLPEHLRADAAARLVDLVRARGDHLTTGFLGVAHLLPVLTRYGHADVAHRLLVQDTFPSWLYSIRQGATTIWERWDGYTRHGGFSDPGMNSFNHYSLGSVGQWLYESVAGLAPAEGAVAFDRVVIAPQPGEFRWARAEHDTSRGRITASWRVEDDALHVHVTLPPNVQAEVRWPEAFRSDGASVGSGRHTLVARRASPRSARSTQEAP
ncbi:alpha-L-rhamnosidase [Deinococcus pimensis]|uniref:alpha-L-rhamnosidase n=1 Tax=Deinococcus pimensis TaxID=309888 RepID=UPI0004B1ADBE|nr:alpha-L-rhamnosidase [Deinococcus pimensis]